MIEVVNGGLIAYFTSLSILSVLTPYLAKPIIKFFSKPTDEERTTWTEVKILKAEQEKLSMKDDFAAYSKLQRKINKLEGTLKENSHNRMAKTLAVKGSLNIGLQVFVSLTIVCSIFWYRREPVVKFQGNLFPFTTLLQFPTSMPNAISAHMWVIITNVTIRTLLKPLIS